MAVTLRDIAEKSGVSLTTVSRIINGDKSISVAKETEEKIWKYVYELGYKINTGTKTSKKFRRKNTNLSIGYILTITKEKFEDTNFSKIIHGIEQELIAQRCDLAFAYTVLDLENPVVLNNVLNSGCDGLIFIGSLPVDMYNLLIKQIPNCVSIFDVPEENIIDCISVELEEYAYKLVKMMIKMGHKNIAFIGGKGYHLSPEENRGGIFYKHEKRFQGYLKALVDSGIEINPNIIRDGNWDIETAYNKMREILDSNEKFTAAFAASDKMAIGAMRAIHERGLRVPEDISVAGFDDAEISKYLNPRLTTVSYPKEELGKLSVNVLIDNISAGNKITRIPKKILLPSYIIERESIKILNG